MKVIATRRFGKFRPGDHFEMPDQRARHFIRAKCVVEDVEASPSVPALAEPAIPDPAPISAVDADPCESADLVAEEGVDDSAADVPRGNEYETRDMTAAPRRRGRPRSAPKE